MLKPLHENHTNQSDQVHLDPIAPTPDEMKSENRYKDKNNLSSKFIIPSSNGEPNIGSNYKVTNNFTYQVISANENLVTLKRIKNPRLVN
jgi:hypothetical protein